MKSFFSSSGFYKAVLDLSDSQLKPNLLPNLINQRSNLPFKIELTTNYLLRAGVN